METRSFQRVPLKKLKSGHYKLSLKINGLKAEFILDTGASTSCMGFESVANFILNAEESDVKAAGAGAINMETKVAMNNEVSIGSVTMRGVDLILFDLNHVNEALSQVDEQPIHGILGADLLKQMRAVIDYGRNCFYIR